MSRSAQRFFGCVLPVTLAAFGCAAMLLVGYAGQAFIQFERISDAALDFPFLPGRTAVIDNTAFWPGPPWRDITVTVARPEGLVLRRVVGLPGEVFSVGDGRIRVNGQDAGLPPVGAPDVGPVQLGPNEYFVWADDPGAADSRTWGPVSGNEIYGRVFVVRDDATGEVFSVRAPPRPEPHSGKQ